MGTSEETINGYKLMRLIVECGQEALCNVFQIYHPGDLQIVLGTHQSTFRNLMIRNIITSLDWEKLYPTKPKIPNINEFDITLLFLLLRNICKISPQPPNGWNSPPSATDESVEADIVRIKLIRNEYYAHISCVRVSKEGFQARWNEVSKPLIRLGVSETKIKQIKEEKISAEVPLELCDFKEHIEKLNKKWFNGTREWVFNQVKEWFNDETSENRPFIITGQVGMGKTVIAATICKQLSEQLGACHFCQVDQERHYNPRILLQSLANQLSKVIPEYKTALIERLFGNRQELDNMTIADLFSLLFRQPLIGIQLEERRMIVIDAVDEIDHEGLSDFVDLIARNLHQLPSFIRFLITSRPDKIFDGLNPLLLSPVEENNVKDIRHIIKNKLPYPAEDREIKRLVHKTAGIMLNIKDYFISEAQAL